jgi:23S rRNA pseudouridine2605 synthase
MFEAVGLTVSRLMRVRYGPLALPPGLARGRYRELDESHVQALLRAVGGD